MVSWTADGNPLLMMGAHQDITERKNSESQIEALLAEKDLILKEVDHRIKNNMYVLRTLLELQSESLDSPEAVAALKDAVGRIYSMGALYNRLYLPDGGGGISVSDYLLPLVDDILALFPGRSLVGVEAEGTRVVLLFPL